MPLIADFTTSIVKEKIPVRKSMKFVACEELSPNEQVSMNQLRKHLILLRLISHGSGIIPGHDAGDAWHALLHLRSDRPVVPRRFIRVGRPRRCSSFVRDGMGGMARSCCPLPLRTITYTFRLTDRAVLAEFGFMSRPIPAIAA